MAHTPKRPDPFKQTREWSETFTKSNPEQTLRLRGSERLGERDRRLLSSVRVGFPPCPVLRQRSIKSGVLLAVLLYARGHVESDR